MITWIQAAIGLFFLLGGCLCLYILLFDKFEDDARWTRVLGVASGIAAIGLGVWLAWPLMLAVCDLFAGSHEARKLVSAREASRAASIGAQYGGFRTSIKVAALVCGVFAPFLCWSMRRAEPDYKRAWTLLLAIPVGYAVLVQWGISAFPQSAFETSLKAFLDGNDTAWVFALYAESLWFGVMVGTSLSGLYVGPWTILLVPIAATPYWIGYYLGYPFWKLMLCWLVGLMIGGFLNAVRKAEEELERSRRISRARELERKVLSGEEGHKFAVYLRPFRLTGTLEAQSVSVDADPLDFETILAAAVRPKLRLLGLITGGDAKIIGADYLYHGNEWLDVVHRLATAARVIFVLPGIGTTIDTEIKWIRDQRLLSKCVFIMPETMTGEGLQFHTGVPTTIKYTEYRDIDHSSDWETARQALLRLGLTLPAYQTEGALFTLHDDGQLKAIAGLHLAGVARRVRRARKAFDYVRKSGGAPASSPGAIARA